MKSQACCWSSGLKHVPRDQCPCFRLINSCLCLNLSFREFHYTVWINYFYVLCPWNHFFFSAHSVLIFLSVFVHLSGMVSSLRLRILVPRAKEALPLTWPSWTSSASSPPNLWDKTRGLCKFFLLLSWRVWGFSVTGVCDNWCNWCLWCVVDAMLLFFHPPVGMCTCLCVKMHKFV